MKHVYRVETELVFRNVYLYEANSPEEVKEYASRQEPDDWHQECIGEHIVRIDEPPYAILAEEHSRCYNAHVPLERFVIKVPEGPMMMRDVEQDIRNNEQMVHKIQTDRTFAAEVYQALCNNEFYELQWINES